MVEQATENRCVGGSIPPLGTLNKMKLLSLLKLLIIVFSLTSCNNEKNFFPHDQNMVWNYEISLYSDYTGNTEIKRLTVTNVSTIIKGKVIEYAKVLSNGDIFTLQKEKFTDKLIRTTAFIKSSSAYDEPVRKVLIPSMSFVEESWITPSQLFITKGYQPPLRDFIPSTTFNLLYKIIKKDFNIKVKGKIYEDCLLIEGEGKSEFVADTRTGLIDVEIKSQEWICNGIGLVKEKRIESTKASAFGNRIYIRELLEVKK